IRGLFSQLLFIKIDIVAVAGLYAGRRPILHLIGADVNRLYKSPLKPTGTAVTFKPMLCLPDTRHMPAHWAVTGCAGFLIVDTKIGVISQKVELIAQCINDCAA